MALFVQDFIRAYPDSTDDDRQQIMSYFPAGFLPAIHSIAPDFTVCDRWYCSVPGPLRGRTVSSRSPGRRWGES